MANIPSSHVLANWVSRLVQIPSITPSQAHHLSGFSGEGIIARQVAQWFKDFGGEVYLDEVAEDRPNVYGIWRGRTNTWAAIDIHLDTVGVGQMSIEPFSGEIKDDCVYGRGAVDTKATLGIILAILEEMYHRKLKPATNLLIVGTADEEVGGLGAPAFAKWVRQKGVHLSKLLVAEPTSCKPVYGHKGEVRMSFTLLGKSAHSSSPHLGKNAITAAAKLIQNFESEHQQLQDNIHDLPLGPATLAVTMITGGTGLNVIPDSCCVSIDRRMLPGENSDAIVHHLSEIARQSSDLEVKVEVLSVLDAFYQSPDSPWIQWLVDQSTLEPGIVPFGTNAWAYKGLAEECVVMGPGSIDQAHSAEEWIAVSELEKMSSILKKWWEVSF